VHDISYPWSQIARCKKDKGAICNRGGILEKTMRKIVRSTIAIMLSLILAALSAALTFSAPLPMQTSFSYAPFLQITPTPQPQDASEIGSTNEIAIMGGVIALIIITPILLRRKSWMQS
jgi:hypothetical protein